MRAVDGGFQEWRGDGQLGSLHGAVFATGGSDLGLFEINHAAQLVAEAAHPEANIIFGAVIDDALGDEARVTVIAAGFDGGEPQHYREPAKRGEGVAATELAPAGEGHVEYERVGTLGEVPRQAGSGHVPAQAARPATGESLDDLDIPDFMK